MNTDIVAEQTLNPPLPAKLCALVGLPRSGTTLVTAIFSVHSQVRAVFEPWNGKGEDFRNLEPTIENVAKEGEIEDVSGKILFVKETASRPIFVTKVRQLVEDAPSAVEKHVLVVLRRPAQTYLSEIARRSGWWGENVAVGPESFKEWVRKNRGCLRMMVQFALDFDGAAIALGAFATRPQAVLEDLGRRIGFEVESAQLEYEKHLELRRVRGDKNVGESPAAIDISKVDFRDSDAAIVRSLLTEPVDIEWFGAFETFYDLADRAGGVIRVADLPPRLRHALLA